MSRSPAELRAAADLLEERVVLAVRRGWHVRATELAAEAVLLREEAERLTGANHSRTVKGMVGAHAKEQDWRKPPSLREVAKMLGCTQGFLSQARAGLTRIRLSWAERIAAVRPDLPATKKTWPKGWAPEQG